MEGRLHPFMSLCQLASREKWCWNITCSTCGHLHFRLGLMAIADGEHPMDAGWMIHKDCRVDLQTESLAQLTQRLRRSRELHSLLAKVDVKQIAANCGYPDWLGYLGLGLYYTEEIEKQVRLLTRPWCEQLVTLVHHDSPASALLADLISDPDGQLQWSHLEVMETHVLPDYRGHGRRLMS